MVFPPPAIGDITLVAHLACHRAPGMGGLWPHREHVFSLHRARGRYGVGGEWHDVDGPFLVLLPAGDRDENHLVGRDTGWWYHFVGGAVRSRPTGVELDLGDASLASPRLRRLSPLEDRSAGAWFREAHGAWRLGTPAARLQCRARLLDLLALWATPMPTDGDDAVDRYRQAIERHACEPSTSLACLAALIGRDADALGAAFRRRVGCAPLQYRTRLRLLRARELLAQEPRPLAEIADACGMRDAGYFCRLFRQHYGTSPGAYARRCRAAPRS